MAREERLRYFDAEIYGKVEGWLGDRVSQIVGIFGSVLDSQGIRGHIVEFGVHHGLYLLLLSLLRNGNELCFAVDCFDKQYLNIDKSGHGSKAVFLSHVDHFMGPERSFFHVIERDTLSFSISELAALFPEPGVKFLSVDAGHSLQHTFNDLALSQEVLVPGGVVSLDDYMSGHWPGVTEGFYKFMSTANRRLRPLLVFQNKLFLTTISEHPLFLEKFRERVERAYAEEIRIGRWREVEITGARCLAFA